MTERKTPPSIPDEAEYDLEQSQPKTQTQPTNLTAFPKQAEPRDFTQWLDFNKVKFGQQLIAWCIFLFITLTLIAFFYTSTTTEGRNALNSALELLKLVTTTALGFVFAKTQLTHQHPPKNENN